MSNAEQRLNLNVTGDQVTIREGNAPEIFVYKGVKYIADSTDSLIALIQSKAYKPNCVIAYTEKGFNAILDDSVIERPQDRLSYEFKKSIQYQEWAPILEKGYVFDQKKFIDFLKRREPFEIKDVESLIAALQNFKFVTNITGDFSFDDRNNYTFAFKVGDAEGTVRLPQTITVSMEILNESGYFQDIELEIEVEKPKSEGEKPLFAIHCPKLPRYLKKAVEVEIDKVKKQLAGYLIVAGSI